ncbi:MAG: hypothetical protein QGF03_04695, partial [SAR324 cluster bacterium]|nr:hypothetical protein [SAR324 cluster bacterium]
MQNKPFKLREAPVTHNAIVSGRVVAGASKSGIFTQALQCVLLPVMHPLIFPGNPGNEHGVCVL